MDITVTLRTSNLPDRLHDDLSRLVTRGAVTVEDDAKDRMLRGPQTGRTYKLKGHGTHRASAKGEAPAVLSGGGLTSVKTVIDGPFSAHVEVGAEHLARLETKMDRPFLRPAMEAAAEEFARDLEMIFRP